MIFALIPCVEEKPKSNSGMDLIVRKYRKQFQISENLNHYSEEDYKIAERKFLKYIMKHGG
jgi:hypothetical protein